MRCGNSLEKHWADSNVASFEDSDGNFAFRNSASGENKSVWVSSDGTWHFTAGIQSCTDCYKRRRNM